MWKQLNLKEDKKALLTYEVFIRQSTGAVSELLQKNNIISKKVLVNKTDLFEPLINLLNVFCQINIKLASYADQVVAQLGWGSCTSWCQSRCTTFGGKAITYKMGSRILSPYAFQHWKENCQERVLKRPHQGSMLETGPTLLRQTVLVTGVQ